MKGEYVFIVLVLMLTTLLGCSNKQDDAWKKLADQHKPLVQEHMNKLAALAYQYMLRPKPMNGGGGSYVGFEIPYQMKVEANANWTFEAQNDKIIFASTDVDGKGTIKATCGSDGKLTSWEYTGYFK